MPEYLERLAAELPFLAPLRRDERARAATHFRPVELAAGEARRIGTPSPEALVVVTGKVTIESVPVEGGAPVRVELGPGDHVGVVALLVGRAAPAQLTAAAPARVALLDRAGYEAIAAEFPAIAIPACNVLAAELTWRDDLLREVAAIEAEHLAPEERAAALDARRRRIDQRLARRSRRARRRLDAWARLARTWLREPAFWMLLGFGLAFAGARLVVAYILRNHLEHRLFALHHVEGFENPIHVHHFNYGLLLVTATSLLAFFPAVRAHLRALALAFGLGAGLIFDEFALIWHLNPDYYQGLSKYAAGAVALLLAQVAFLRGPWERLLRRLRRREGAP